jgi:hypothetical protein
MTNDYSYIEIGNADITGELNPSITAKSTYNIDVGININALNAGNIVLNASQGNVNVNTNNLIISNNLVVNNSLVVDSNISVKNSIVTGYSVSSIYRTSSMPGGYQPQTYWNVPLLTDTILFNFTNSSTSGSYYANVGAGVDGQKLNLVFNNSNISNFIDVMIFFGENKILVGSGNASSLSFNTTGQGSTLMFLGEDINCWQALNTGAALF